MMIIIILFLYVELIANKLHFAQPNKNCKRSTICVCVVSRPVRRWTPLIKVIFIEAPNPVVMSFMMVDNRKCS